MYRAIISSESTDPNIFDVTFNFTDLHSFSFFTSNGTRPAKKRVPYVGHPQNSSEEKISDEQLSMYNHFLKEVYRKIIHIPELRCTGFGPGSDPYSYYIEFQSTKSGELWKISFRVSIQRVRDIDKEVSKAGTACYQLLRSVVIGRNQEFIYSSSALSNISHMLEFIANRDRAIENI